MSNTIVRTNVMSLNSHRNLGLVGNQQNRASQRLSSGFRINSAADDAAGLGISEKMRSQIRGLDQASRNGQDGISLIQTAEGAMATINEMVTRIRELVVQASNDTNVHDSTDDASWAQSDRTRIQAEINQLMSEIDATRNRTEFNTRTLLDGSIGDGSVGGAGANILTATGRAGAHSAFAAFRAAVSTAISETRGSTAGIGTLIDDAIGIGLSAQDAGRIRDDIARVLTQYESRVLNADSVESANDARTALETALNGIRRQVNDRHAGEFTDATGPAGAFTDLLNGISSLAGGGTNLSGTGLAALQTAHNTLTAVDDLEIVDPDDPNAVLTTGTAFDLGGLGGGGGALWFQVGANVDQGVSLSIRDVGVDALDNAGRGTGAFNFLSLRTTGIEAGTQGGVLNGSGEEIQNFITAIDFALSHVTNERSNLGAMQNRLEFTIQNLDISSENLSNANSRIRDADMASEMMRLTQSNVLQQAAISMLAQANQAPQSILQLLG